MVSACTRFRRRRLPLIAALLVLALCRQSREAGCFVTGLGHRQGSLSAVSALGRSVQVKPTIPRRAIGAVESTYYDVPLIGNMSGLNLALGAAILAALLICVILYNIWQLFFSDDPELSPEAAELATTPEGRQYVREKKLKALKEEEKRKALKEGPKKKTKLLRN
eukprot:TRINITY_DN25786_c0_g1_i1.p1 TRINITY_DN25786_c0_g1~~TRINITY_DN25786_c0_g1_i1.p1  ORF type:complete len:189 (-),score=29.43 TRINITY_DN25786_c0_g1_i1:66-560(-)